jgi:hypothetical protein
MHLKLIAAAVATLSLAAACLERPVVPTEPRTSNQFVDQIVQNRIERIDLLFMIDNSRSMADKQEILKQAVPVLLNRLVSPICVDERGAPVGGNAPCVRGAPEFTPIKDIHIGVVTSDLGDMSGYAAGCTNGDRGLIAGSEVHPNLVNWNSQGFLAWDPDAITKPRNDPPGMTQAPDLIGAFQNMVVAAGESGCGFEASLESWYRFLVDPEPPEKVSYDPTTGQTTAAGIDKTILAQRAAFLRSDSLLAIVMLTDENDCSIADFSDGGVLGYAGSSQGIGRMPKSTSACDRDVNDACCVPCGVAVPGCPTPDADPKCQSGYFFEDETAEPANLRCFQQRKRFGKDFLQPLSRYVDGLTLPQIYNRRGEQVPNPIFAAPVGVASRDRSLVYLAGITGVPWQDVSDEASWSDPRRLRYLSYTELEAKGRFDWMLGKPGERPQDPFMVESIQDRTTIAGLSPAHPAGAAVGSLAPATATRLENPINGHESAGVEEPQYACIFPKTPTTCEGSSLSGPPCDCYATHASLNRSLCEGNVQTHAKAFPGTRQLEVLRGVGMRTKNAIVASICPKVTDAADPAADPDYGYNPAVTAVIERLKEQIAVKCLPRQLEVDGNGQVPCRVIEAGRPDAENGRCAPCDTPGRKALGDSPVAGNVRDQLASAGHCGVPGTPACKDYCLCEVEQFSGANLGRCQGSAEPLSDAQGFCYVDGIPHGTELPTDDQVLQRAASVSKCPATQRRVLRFSSEVPAKGSVAYIACTGEAIH